MCDKLLELKTIIEGRGGQLISDKYINSHSPISCIDEEGNVFSILPYSLKQGRWSPQTSEKRKAKTLSKYTIQDLRNEASLKGGKCLDDIYINDKHKYNWEDRKGRHFKMSWHNVFKMKQWSPHEKRETLSKLKTLYTIEHLQEFARRYGAECLSTQYTTLLKKYVWKDRNGKVFTRTWQDVKKRKDLLARMRSSHEEQIDDFIKSLGFETETDKTILNGKELDVLIKSRNFAVEMNGVYWHTEHYGKDHKYHYNKFKDCNDANIDLMQVYDIEWEERSDQIKSFLTAKLGCNVTIGARHTQLVIVDKQIAKKFLNDYHIQGSCIFDVAYGLYNNNELLALITISKHHRGGDSNVLSRYVGKTGISVIGGLSKLVKRALQDYGKLITWVDLRYSSGNNWVKAGWKLEQLLKPDYRYYDQNTNKFISKQSRQKNKIGTPAGMTESEHAVLDGLTRIYDAGKIRLSISL